MNTHHLKTLARRWLPLLVLGPLLGGLAGYLVVQRIPSVYQATVTLIVQPGIAQSNGVQDLQEAQDLAATYASAIHTRTILTDAASQVGLGGLPESELENRVQAQSVTGTELLQVTVDDTDPARAAQFANTVAQVFVQNNTDAQASRFASSLANLSQLVDQIQQDISSRVAAINDLNAQPASPARDAQVLELQNDLTQVRTTYGNTVNAYQDLRVTEARAANTATIFDPAVPPTAPVRPNRALTTFLAALAGLAVASGIVVLAEYFDDRLDSRARVARALGLSTLGVLPNARPPQSLRDANGWTALRDYRALRSRLLVALPQAGVRSLLVTSASVGEGKSTLAATLALVLAEAGQRVILVDADVHSPAHMRLFGLPNQPGLLSLLAAEPGSSVPAVLSDTWVPNLKVVTTGPIPSDPLALLSSRRLGAMLDDFVSQCDVLLVDVAPVLAEPDSLILCAHVDAVLFVVDAQRTRGQAATRAVASLQSAGAHLLGAILNRAGTDSVELAPSPSSTGTEVGAEPTSPGRLPERSVERVAASIHENSA